MTTIIREPSEGMGMAVAQRTILRNHDGLWETWKDVAHRVSLGNSLLCPTEEDRTPEQQLLEKHIGKGIIMLSGRSLQHGDKNQPLRNGEVFTNCSMAANSFLLFYLLLNGSGVGRVYDDDICIVNWDNGPTVRCVLSDSHPDFDFSAHESVRDAKHKYGNGKDVMWFKVPDSREGWAKAIEIWENAAHEKIHKDKMLILDFSDVREKNKPIGGMQNRPASGPVPLMNAIMKCASLRGAGLDPWLQAMYIDHYLAECVLVGGARRAARMAAKFWKDKSVLKFIEIKRPIEFYGKSPEEVASLRKKSWNGSFLWSSNNSVFVDEEFWKYVNMPHYDLLETSEEKELWHHAHAVFNKIAECSYGDGTGEPGIINQDKLIAKDKGIEKYKDGDYVGSKKYQVNDDTRLYLAKLAKRLLKKKYSMGVNPCLPASATVLTPVGIRTIGEIEIGNKIWSETGWTTVTNKWSTGIKDVYRYSTTCGYFLGTENHRILQNSSKIEVSEATGIDVLSGNTPANISIQLSDVMDGLVIGDGSVHKASNNLVYLCIGENDYSYHTDPVRKYILEQRKGLSPVAWEIDTTIKWYELPETYNREIPERFFKGIPSKVVGFLRGLYSANGSVCGQRVTLKTASPKLRDQVMIMLSSIGIKSYYTTNKSHDVKFANGYYTCKESYDVNITKDIELFQTLIGFIQDYKNVKVAAIIKEKHQTGRNKLTYDINLVEKISTEEVFDITVDNSTHTFWNNGLNVSNCSEICILMLGAYCVIGDVIPYHADTLDEAEDAFRATTRALIRINLMDCLYSKEVKRTNRIGVGITGVHEFAWKFFNLTFRDLLDEEKSEEFWKTMVRFSKAVTDEAIKYSKYLGVEIPHTALTVKPSGCMESSTKIKTDRGILSLSEIFDLNKITIDSLAQNQFFNTTEKIYVYDENNNLQLIEKLYVNTILPTISVELEDGCIVEVSADHKFLTTNRGWVRAEDLQQTDNVVQY